MALEQKLNLRLSQKLIMTPSLQQAIRMLQMTKLELQEEVTQELTENPLLEESQDAPAEGEEAPAQTAESADGETPSAEDERERDSFDEIDYESYFQDYMDLSYRPQAPAEEVESRPLDNILSKPKSLADHLLWQLDMTITTPRRTRRLRAPSSAIWTRVATCRRRWQEDRGDGIVPARGRPSWRFTWSRSSIQQELGHAICVNVFSPSSRSMTWKTRRPRRSSAIT